MNWKQETNALIDIIEIYYKKGGFSELPNEVINDIEGTLEEQTEEIERLNNIINEFEKWLKDYINLFKKPDIYEEQTLEDLKGVLDKLQELKGEDKGEDK